MPHLYHMELNKREVIKELKSITSLQIEQLER